MLYDGTMNDRCCNVNNFISTAVKNIRVSTMSHFLSPRIIWDLGHEIKVEEKHIPYILNILNTVKS